MSRIFASSASLSVFHCGLILKLTLILSLILVFFSNDTNAAPVKDFMRFHPHQNYRTIVQQCIKNYLDVSRKANINERRLLELHKRGLMECRRRFMMSQRRRKNQRQDHLATLVRKQYTL